VVFAAYGEVKRGLCTEVGKDLKELKNFYNPQLCMPGVVALQADSFSNYDAAQKQMQYLNDQLADREGNLKDTPFIIVCDDSSFVAATLSNYLWVTYTRCNPSHDIYGINSFFSNKHWGCTGPLIIDARIKPHHAPPVEKDPVTERSIDRIFTGTGSLAGVIQ
jgi:4-hydroxy-3-polyprenylbenzoate decarboxylase